MTSAKRKPSWRLWALNYHEFPREARFLTAQAYKSYRQRGGVNTAPRADFFSGSHAAVLDVPLITRDGNRYRTYFPGVSLITP